MTNNLGPTVVNKNGIALNRSDDRFKDARQRAPSPSYLPALKAASAAKRPFNMQSERFEQIKPNDAHLGPGFYTVSVKRDQNFNYYYYHWIVKIKLYCYLNIHIDNVFRSPKTSDAPIGRHVERWNRIKIDSNFLRDQDHSRVPLRSALNEQRQVKRFERKLQYLQLYY